MYLFTLLYLLYRRQTDGRTTTYSEVHVR